MIISTAYEFYHNCNICHNNCKHFFFNHAALFKNVFMIFLIKYDTIEYSDM